MDCQHKNTAIKKVLKSFFEESHSFKLKVCNDCQSEFWGQKEQERYYHWMNDIYLKKRHLFQIQYKINDNLHACLEKLNEKFPNANESQLVRSLIMVYINVVEENESLQKKMEKHINNSDQECSLLTKNAKRLKKVQFNVLGMEDIFAVSEMLSIKPHNFIENALFRMLFIFINEDPEMKQFWQEFIFKNLSMILKAA